MKNVQLVSSKTYLDTSSIRKARNFGDETVVFTSALTLVELLNGIADDDKSYSRRRGSIKRILENPQINIIWKLPDELMLHSFAEFHSQFTFREKRLDPLKRIADLVVECDNRQDFIDREREVDIPFHLAFFEELDSTFGEAFRLTTEQANKEVRAAFDSVRLSANGVIPEEIRQGSFRNFCTWFRDQNALLNKAITIKSLACRAVKTVGLSPEDDLVGKWHASYDRSIDRFIDGFSYACMTMMSNMSGPARNDALDLAHLLYLQDDGISLATEDTMLANVAREIGITVK